MKHLLFIVLLAAAITGCKNKSNYDVDAHHTAAERDSLLADIITYVYIRPQGAESLTRFDQKFRSYYVNNLKRFQFDKYFVGEDGTHYYFIIRPARSANGNIRGVGGTFKLDEQGKIKHFREVYNTPVASLDVLKARGGELFIKMVKRGHIDDYLKNPDYIEWPDKMTYYDTLQYEWLVKPGI